MSDTQLDTEQTDGGGDAERTETPETAQDGRAEPEVRSPTGPTRTSTSTASCPGSTSTTGCSSWPRTRSLPLMERVKFLAIFTTNLDEFFMVRVAGVHDQLDARIDARGPDGLSPTQVLRGIAEQGARAGSTAVPPVHRRRQARAGRARHQDRHVGGVLGACEPDRAPVPRADLPGADAAGDRSGTAVPVHLEPVAEPDRAAARSGPRSGGLRAREGSEGGPAPVRRDLTRTASSRSSRSSPANLDALFPGMDIISYDMFRVTRDADFEVSDEADDLLQAVEDELRRRRFGEVVRLEVGASHGPRRCAAG